MAPSKLTALALLFAAGCAPDSGSGSASSEGQGGAGGAGSGGAGATTAATTTGAGAGATTSATTSGPGGGSSSGGGDDASSSTTGGAGGEGGSDTSSTGGSGGEGGAGEVDGDGDGFLVSEGDCRDNDANVFPGAPELCNFVDDNCDDVIDEGFDQDDDGFRSCAGDCNDADAAVNPGAIEIENGIDDDCTGIIDEPWLDEDGDGFGIADGDCDDVQPEINPNALEFVGNNADDDCDGLVDEALLPCDGGALNSDDPLDFGRAIGLCNGELVGGQIVSGPNVARAILTSFGSHPGQLNQPAEGSRIVHLSSGRADTSQKDSGYAYDGSLAGGCTSSPHPAPLGDPGACGDADPANVCDKTEISLQIRVPSNALSFTYQFQFFSSEYPTFRCTAYDDTFLALLSSQEVNGGAPTNISFDLLDRVVSVNTGFFDVCFDAPGNDCTVDPISTLSGTGYSPFGGAQSIGAGATLPLTTTSPVLPGEIITLRFIIFDEGDDQLDSSVLIDNFQWSLDPADGPTTNPT